MSGDLPDQTPSWEELFLKLSDMAATTRKLLRSFDKIDIQRDNLEFKLEDIQTQIRELQDFILPIIRATRGPRAGSRSGSRSGRLKAPWAGQAKGLQDQATQGIRQFQIEWINQRTIRVTLDGQVLKFPLGLAKVLNLLAKADTEWCRTGESARALSITVPAFHERIRRLRRLLWKQGSNPPFIQTEGKGENARVRLARQRGGTDGAVAALTDAL